MLYGFDVPTDLVTTSATPRLSKTARSGPPAMMPVPAGAERHVALPAPKKPLPYWGRGPAYLNGNRTITLLATAVAFQIAPGRPADPRLRKREVSGGGDRECAMTEKKK